jgi:hypothetical protein
MRKSIIFTGLVVALALCIFAPHAGAQMSSPYLVGEWEMFRVLYYNPFSSDEFSLATQYKVVNPTTTPLDVYLVLLDRYGNLEYEDDTPMCFKMHLDPNTTWKPCFPFYNSEDDLIYPAGKHLYGAAKFFAYPANILKFDPNAVIAGFQQKSSAWGTESSSVFLPTEAPLLPITINSRTIGEFTKYPLSQCQPWRTWCWHCSGNYNNTY